MLKNISPLGWSYFTYCLVTCGYFTTAAIGGWKGLSIDVLPSSGYSNSYSSGGSSYGRSSGGSWGGGK